MPSLIKSIGYEPQSWIYKTEEREKLLDLAVDLYMNKNVTPHETENGENLLHKLAAWKKPDVELIKTAIVFGTNPTMRNGQGKTPLDVLIGAKRHKGGASVEKAKEVGYK